MKKIILVIVAIFSFSTLFSDNIDDLKSKNDNQKTTTLSGKIVDLKTGESIVGACITINETQTNFYTDLDGNFIIPNLQNGVYKINVKMISYKEINNITITVKNNQIIDKNIILEPEQ